jgi:hypothetical protein
VRCGLGQSDEALAGNDIAVTGRDGQTFHYCATAAKVVRFDASGIDPLANGYELHESRTITSEIISKEMSGP